jgi:thiosulfate dehydrogenase (quinone) large subunit
MDAQRAAVSGWFSVTAPLWTLALARIVYGLLWWQQSKWKVPSDDFGRKSGGGLWYWIQQEIQYPTVGAYRDFLVNVMIPHWTLFGYITLATETFIGLTLILGLFTRLGALAALGMSLNVTLGILSVPHEWGWTYAMMIALAALFLLTGAGRSVGLDSFLGPRLDQAAGEHRIARLLRWLT